MKLIIYLISLFVASLAFGQGWNVDLLDERYLGFWLQYQCIDVQGDYAYLANDFYSMNIYDISDPTDIQTVWPGISIEGPQLVVRGDYVYSVGGTGMTVIDVSDPFLCQQVFRMYLLLLRDIVLMDNYAFVSSIHFGLFTFDISDPENPTIVNLLVDVGALRLALQGDYLYSTNSERGLVIYDISDPLNPIEVGEYADLNDPFPLDVSGDFVYVGDYDGLKTICISDPSDPREINSFICRGRIDCVTAVPNYVYVGANPLGFQIYDVSDHLAPFQVGYYGHLSYKVQDIYVMGEIALSAETDYFISYSCSAALPVAPSASADQDVPESFSVYPPYPNPFNPTTTIRFDLPVASQVILNVFDIHGRNVVGARHASPMSGSGTTPTPGFYTPGTHSIIFDASDLSSGIYFYRLEAGEFNATGKMVLMK